MKVFEFRGEKEEHKYVEIMPVFMRAQHLLLMITVILLSITGFSILFHRTVASEILVAMEGGFRMRGLLHRAGAVMLLLLVLYHLFYIFYTREGSEEFRKLIIRKKDLADFVQMMKFDLRVTDSYPTLGRYCYKEKFQYWGVNIGLMIMILSGIILWFESGSMRIFPKWVLDVTMIIHGYEGMIVFIILLFWHMYNVHFSPGNFLRNNVWITGKVDRERLSRERTGYPEIKEGEEGT